MEPARALRLSAAVALATLLAALLAATSSAWLALLLPAQTTLARALLPEFELQPLALVEQAGTLGLELRGVTREHVVLQGRVIAPGADVAVRTPARQALRQALLALALCTALLLMHTRASRLVVFVLLGAAGVVGTAPLVLAGQAWALGLQDLAEPSLRALLVTASRLLLDGADVAALLLAAMVLSDHPSAWFGRITPTPTDGGRDEGTRRRA